MSSTKQKELPRLPLHGSLDITYRCNNTCRHCWLWQPINSPNCREELSFTELRRIVEEARSMGCQTWGISGGEPMLRPDFAEIFDYITRRSISYSLNTNGSLITPEIARLLKRKGRKMVALYGATAEVQDQVTRNPGSFAATMQGFAYLKEAGAEFIVQIVPMRTNFHQYNQMLALAQSLSPDYRIGAPWLWLSACRSDSRNREIAHQRLDPVDVIALDHPISVNVTSDGSDDGEVATEIHSYGAAPADERIFAVCIASRRDFHIDPYGKISFCYYIKDPVLRYNLLQGSFQQAWDEFIPSLAGVVHGGQEYLNNCGSCDLRRDCRWCGVYAYLEHGRFSAKVDYLCQVAGQARKFKEDWKLTYLRYYQIAGITIQVTADFPITDLTFSPVFSKFLVNTPGSDMVSIQHHSMIPAISNFKLDQEVYHRPPWAIYKNNRSWVYLGILPGEKTRDPYILATSDLDHNKTTIYHHPDTLKEGLISLTGFSSDQILFARILANRQACYLHASGIIVDGKGFLFVGHSEAGKSTMMMMLREYGEILCDDRVIVRRWPDGFRIHGTWSHGDLPDVSPASAPLQAILFLEKATTNELIPITEKIEKIGKLLSCVIKPLVTADWWEKTMDLSEKIATEVPIYRMRFDLSGQVVDLLRQL